jgi:hypothetical protein
MAIALIDASVEMTAKIGKKAAREVFVFELQATPNLRLAHCRKVQASRVRVKRTVEVEWVRFSVEGIDLRMDIGRTLDPRWQSDTILPSFRFSVAYTSHYSKRESSQQ